METENNTETARVPRQGWEEQFRQFAESSDDALLDADALSLTEWDETEWEWGDADETPATTPINPDFNSGLGKRSTK